ncbi:hypothetical protein KP509_01G042000 [Ceratopteris richardii]|nr:hypothetical protein KP509_01G042000 [Ceratopteris richardii]
MSLALSAGGGKVWSQTLLQDVRSSASCFSLACTTVRGQGTLFKNVSAKSDSSRSSSSASLNVNGKGFGEDADACFLSPRSAPASCKVSRFSYSSVDSARGLLCSRMSTCFRGRMRRQRERRKQRRSTQRGRVSAYRRVLRSLKSPKKLKSKTHTISVKFNGRSRSSLHSISKEDIKGLESLIPGGRIMDVPLLLSETAHYILSLQMQVEVLQSISHLVTS